MANEFRFLTMWTLVIFFSTLVICGLFPKLLPLWFFIGVACLMTSIGVVGSMIFNTISLHNDPQKKPNQIVEDFGVHIFPVLLLFLFYPIFKKRFNDTGYNFIKSALFPFTISIIYISTHDVEEIYSMSHLSAFTIILLTLSVWISSYPIFTNVYKE